jgi:hypothetical protein
VAAEWYSPPSLVCSQFNDPSLSAISLVHIKTASANICCWSTVPLPQSSWLHLHFFMFGVEIKNWKQCCFLLSKLWVITLHADH